MKLSWQQIPSTTISEMLCYLDLDGVVLDTEHGMFNNETLYNCIQIITSNNKKCFVRVTEPNKTYVRACLDAGCDGLIFSTLEEEEQCEEIFKICKFPSFGGKRGLGLVRENKWGMKNLISSPPTIIAQIETKEGVKNLDKILSYNFDFYMIGPYDLSASIGNPGDFNSKEYLNTIATIKSKIPNEKMAVHIPTDVKKQLKKYENYGIVAVGMDTTAFLDKYMEIARDA